jgi:hypothetical protein
MQTEVENEPQRTNAMDLHLGFEPKFKGVLEVSKSDMMRSLNWYLANKTRDDSVMWFIKKFPDVTKAASDIIGNAGFLVRMTDRGLPFDQAISDHIQSRYVAALKVVSVVKEERKAAAVNKVVARDTVLDGFMESIDYAIDDVLTTGTVKVPTFNGLKPVHKRAILKFVKSKIAEYESDETFDESAYRNKREVNALIRLMSGIATALDKTTVAKKPRKVKPKKAVLPEKVVLKFKAKVSDGVKLTKLVGAKGALVFDEQRRRIMFFEGTTDGLSVKGTTLINVASTSVAKTLRKPEEQLPQIKGLAFRAAQKAINEIKGVALTPKARGKESWLILAIY